MGDGLKLCPWVASRVALSRMLVSTANESSRVESDDAVRAMLAAVEAEDEVASKQDDVLSILPGSSHELVILVATGALLAL